MTINETRVAVVTGAGRGIGLAIARALVADGWTVVAGSRTVTDELRAATPDVLDVDLATPAGPAGSTCWSTTSPARWTPPAVSASSTTTRGSTRST